MPPPYGDPMKYALTLAAVLLSFHFEHALAEQTLLLRQPAVSADKLAFVYAGDIWVANRDGSEPRRLTSHPASETHPRFSPDGSQVSFLANYEDNSDVYVLPAAGGQPQRLTWHPATDTPTGWTPDGSAVTFVSNRETDHGRSGQWYHASLQGGLPAKQMESRIYRGVYDADGRRLAYIPFRSGYSGLFGGPAGWKGYRGGTTPPIQIMDLAAKTVVTVPGDGATNFNPMWVGGTLYFLSDRGDKIANVYRYDHSTGEVHRVSSEDVWEIRSADGHGTSIVYEAGGRLKHLDVESGTTSEIVISINPDLPQRQSRWRSVSDRIETADISPAGKRAIFTARGDVFTVPIEEGPVRNITGSGTVREYSGIWSPNGDQIAYIAESGGSQSLIIDDQTGVGPRTTHELGPHFYTLIGWSNGDAPRIVYQDNHLSLYALDLEKGTSSKLDTGARREAIEAALSPDGKWIAYTVERANYHRDLVLHNFSSATSTVVTDGAADAASPAFSQDGKYLFFAASTNAGPLQVGLNMSSRERPYRAGLYAAVLAADGKSPLLPPTGDENEDDEATAEEPDDAESGEKEDSLPETRIDLEGLSGRIVALPLAERNYSNLKAAHDGSLYYIESVQPGASNEPPGTQEGAGNALMRFDFEEKKATSMLDGAIGFRISADGQQILIAKADQSYVFSKLPADSAGALDPKPVALGGLRVRIDPREEWRQIFDEAWRMEKEYFYDPGMHGLDWQAVYDRYSPLVEHVGRREDLNELMVEMIAEMQVGHNNVLRGDVHKEEGTSTGLLGANLTVEDGRYRIARVYTGESWNPFIAAPLATPGNEARDGDFILAVNGRDLNARDNIFELLQGTVGQQVTLRVGPRANGADARDIVVEPVASERQLRLWRWVENNRQIVSEATDGRVGYVYLPNTAGAGFTFFNRMFFAQVDKEALIIDERSNAGGQAANYITDILSRRHLSGWKDRDGLSFDTPAGVIHGPKVMLIDQDAGSGGDFLPYSFRHLGIGKLIGTRTWGGLIGISANPQLVDGGTLTVPFFRFFDADGAWTVENEGVAPDIEVALDPIATNEGRDSQLERAIAEILVELEGYESSVPAGAPPYPTELGE